MPKTAISEVTRQLAGWRLRLASEQTCPSCSSRQIAVVVFGRTNLSSEELLDELFGMGHWVDGGSGTDRDMAYQCTKCSQRFGSQRDIFGIFGLPDLSV